jgi:hypothetical protein
VIRGLILDKQKGNLVKADRFGQIKRAMHGTKMLSSHAIRSGLELFKPTLLHTLDLLQTGSRIFKHRLLSNCIFCSYSQKKALLCNCSVHLAVEVKFTA